MRTRTWARLAIGVLVIGGTFATLWAIYQPSVDTTPPEPPAPPIVRLRDARAVVLLYGAAQAPRLRAVIRCRGNQRSASGFWARRPVRACDALASTRGALLAGPGCRRTQPDRVRLHVVGAFGPHRFDRRQQRGGCPDPEGWLAVNALASPVLVPEREAEEARSE